MKTDSDIASTICKDCNKELIAEDNIDTCVYCSQIANTKHKPNCYPYTGIGKECSCQIANTICNDEFDLMPHKFKCQKESGHPIGYHFFRKDDWDEASVIVFWRHQN